MPPSVISGNPTHPPVAERDPQVSTLHGETRQDDYAWLRRKDDPRVRAYLEAENAWADACMQGSEELQSGLYEMLARIQQPTCRCPTARQLAVLHANRGGPQCVPLRHRTMDAPEQCC
jgi:oligopeptidase B